MVFLVGVAGELRLLVARPLTSARSDCRQQSRWVQASHKQSLSRQETCQSHSRRGLFRLRKCGGFPPSVAKAALWGPTCTLLTCAQLRNSLGKGAISSSCAQREKLPAKTAVPSSISTVSFTLPPTSRQSVLHAMPRKADFD